MSSKCFWLYSANFSKVSIPCLLFYFTMISKNVYVILDLEGLMLLKGYVRHQSNSIFDHTRSRVQSNIIPALYLNDAPYSQFCQGDLPVHSYITRNNHGALFFTALNFEISRRGEPTHICTNCMLFRNVNYKINSSSSQQGLFNSGNLFIDNQCLFIQLGGGAIHCEN